MRHGSIPDAGGPGRRCRLPELPRPYSAEPDPVQRLLAFAYLQAQKGHREAEQELRKDADTLSAVLAAQAQIASAQFDLEQSLEFIAEGARRLTGAGGAAIALRDGERVVCRGRSGLMAPELGSCLNPQSGVCGECLTSGEVQLCDDTEHDPRVDIWVCRNLGMRSILAVPLRRQQDGLGIFVVFSGWAGVFGERDIRALRLLAGLVIEALWSHEARERQATLPNPDETSETAEASADSIAAAMAEFRHAMASMVLPEPLPEPAAPVAEVEEESAKVETPVAAEAEVRAPAFIVLGNSEPRRFGRTLAIVAGIMAVLAGATEAGVWRGAHVRELLHRFRPAAVAPQMAAPVPATTPASENPNSASIAESAITVTPELSSNTVAAAGPSQLLAIRTWSKPEGTTIALFLQAPARWQAGKLKDPARIYFDLENTGLARELLGKSREGLAIPVNDALVNRVRVGLRESSAVRIVIDLAAPAAYSAVLSAAAPYRLMIVLRSAQAPASKPVTPKPAPSNKTPGAQTNPPGPRASLTHPKIVIDPGHGGTEDGAIGHGGLKEKELTLQISRKLGDLLANRLGAEVIYTRTSDLTVPLEARAAVANQAGADLFISVHANSSDDPGARGVETYYVSNPSPVAASVEAGDRAGKAGAVRAVAEDFKLGESHKLAVEVQQALYHAFGGEKGVLNRGVKQAPFVVLLDAEMPSILAEVAFVTSPADEQKLSSGEGQAAAADALYRGIARYLASPKRGKVVASLGASSGQ